MTSSRLRTTTALAVAAAALAAAPAHAAPAPIVAGASFARTIPFIDGDLYVWECHAGAPGAATITISRCATGSIADPPVAGQQVAGTAVQVSGVSRDSQATQVCWTASATYADGSSQTASGCTTTSDIAGAGAGTS